MDDDKKINENDINKREDNTFKIIGDNGEEIECEILFTYCDEKTGKNYIAYTDNTFDEDENTKVFASIFNLEEENPILLPIETEKEWNLIEQILTTISNKNNDDNQNNIEVLDDSLTNEILELLNYE